MQPKFEKKKLQTEQMLKPTVSCMRLEVLTVVGVKITVLQDLTQYSLVGRYKIQRKPSGKKREAAESSETLAPICLMTRRHFAKYHNPVA